MVRECFDRGRRVGSACRVGAAVAGVNGVVNGSELGFVELEPGLAGALGCARLFMVDVTSAVASSRSGVIHPHGFGSIRCDEMMLAPDMYCCASA